MSKCKVRGCRRETEAKGYCAMHYKRVRRIGSHGQAKPLVMNTKRYGPICSAKGCGSSHYRAGYCRMHLERVRDHGSPGSAKRKNRLQGQGTIVGEGYLVLFKPNSPYCRNTGYILEHHLVMCEFLGRRLDPCETVHHKNGVRLDNRLSNLELWTSRHPKGQRVSDMIDFAIEILSKYKPEALSKKI